MQTRVDYEPASGERAPFARAKLDLCATKCHRANISLSVRLLRPLLPEAITDDAAKRAPTDSLAVDNDDVAAAAATVAATSDASAQFGDVRNISQPPGVADDSSGGSGHGDDADEAALPRLAECDRDTYALGSMRRLCGK